MRREIIAASVLIVFAGMAHAGTRADLSGDAVVDFATTMDMPFVAVGNLGNAPDDEIMSDGTSGYGAVHYGYNIGKFEVTAGQYTEFLNAVATTDTYGLYSAIMESSSHGCQITRHGASGSYTYDFAGRPNGTAEDWENRPVNFVDWGDAARFANWLHNGQPTGLQDITTTEGGSYFLNGAMYDQRLMLVTREPNARYVLPTEDEWYKAAYHKNDGVTGNYFDYPTSSDSPPGNDVLDPDPGNNANVQFDGYVTDYGRTEAGEFENSGSPYGTLDQGGNVWEWNETVVGSRRNGRGGSYLIGSSFLHVDYRNWNALPTHVHQSLGFRIAEVPEPATLSLLALGGLAMLRRRRRVD